MPDVRLCAVGDLEPDTARRFDVGRYRLALVRIGDDQWFCLDDRCTHAEASLSEGPVWPDDCEIECPRHGSVFDLRSGKALTLPATRPARTYEVRIQGDDVMVVLP